MPGTITRVLSDIHYGDRASLVRRLRQLRPLLDGPAHVVLNGDTLDTRPGPNPMHTAACRAEVLDFFPRETARTTFLTGNHDADLSPHHRLDLHEDRVLVVHGDIFFDDLVPWSRDAPLISRLIAEEMKRHPDRLRHDLDHRLGIWRRIAAVIPQRHECERNSLRYLIHYLADTVWPPGRMLRILRAWRAAPANAAALARRHRPAARFVLAGHTHLPGVWTHDGITIINTGSFTAPFGGSAVDIAEDRLVVRRIERRRGEFRLARQVAEFPLARA